MTPGARQRRIEGVLQCPVADDVAERIDALVAGVETRATEAAALRDVDRRDWRDRTRRGRDLAPDAEPFEDEAGAVRQRQRAIASRYAARRPRVERDDVEAALTKRERECRAHGTHADDDKVVHRRFAHRGHRDSRELARNRAQAAGVSARRQPRRRPRSSASCRSGSRCRPASPAHRPRCARRCPRIPRAPCLPDVYSSLARR